MKRNITPLNNALSVIKQLNPKTYEFRYNEEKFKNAGLDNKTQMGFIAQEIEQVIPNIINKTDLVLNPNNYSKAEIANNPNLAKKEAETMEIKAVNHDQFIPLLTQAIKEQQVIIEEQNKRIEKLEEKVNSIAKK